MSLNELEQRQANTHKQAGASTTEQVQMNSRTSTNRHEHADKGAQTSANKQVAGTSMNEHG